jgi:NadR type nicotinamide-nucleotide adenylyltransferase
VEKKKIIRIAVTGPESTGKTTLAKELAKKYNTVWVPEIARNYLTHLNRPYEEKDLAEIARLQRSEEEKLINKANQIIFCDTEMLVIKIWSEFKYKSVDPYILNELQNQNYDAYLLCGTDLPWEYDVLREHPGMRESLYKLYYSELEKMNAPFIEVWGTVEERIKFTEILLKKLL